MGRWSRCAIGLATILAFTEVRAGSNPRSDGTTIQVSEGMLAGSRVAGGQVFYDIPFAASPVGRLRWRPPAPATHWRGARQASRPGAACMQEDMGWNTVDAARSAEDCLYLNVWTQTPVDGPRAVMVWIHGGGFVGGAGNTPLYDGAALMRRGVVVVTINYRLGVFGFLANPRLSAEDPQAGSGNYGIEDQIAALEWVHRNISRFGGDPSNVTVFGQSAGAISISRLMAMPRARGLFRRAILESGTPGGVGSARTLGDVERDDGAFGNVDELRAMPADALLRRWTSYARDHQIAAAPVVDGRLMQEARPDALAKDVVRYDLLVGSNVQEITPPLSRAELATGVAHAYGTGNVARRIEAYADAELRQPDLGDAGAQFQTDTMFRCPAITTASQARSRTWLYQFGQPGPGFEAVGHSSELPYVFGTAAIAHNTLANRPFDSAEQRLSDRMQAYWTTFAKTGDPNGVDVPHWKGFDPEARGYQWLSATDVEGRRDLRVEFCPQVR